MRLLLLEVVVGGLEGAGHDGLVGLVEVEERHAPAAPASLDGREDVGLVGDEGVLLFGGELEDAAALFLGVEGGEDLVVEPEVGVVHVGAFDGSGEFKGEAAEDGYVRVGLHLFSLLLSTFVGGSPPIAWRQVF